MAILDQLMEKKDLMIYIRERMKQLKKFNIMQFEPKERQTQKKMLHGRFRELERLKILLEQGTLKDSAKKAWDSVEKPVSKKIM